MRFIRRLFKWTAILVVLAVVAVAAVAIWYVRAVEPQVAGTIRLPGFERPVEVVRDREGVAHIFAASMPRTGCGRWK
jgi:penicillin G amidase